MSLPDGFLDELRTRLSLAQVVGRKVAWDLRKSNQAKGDMWAPCPFHQEKTASFHVDDGKGFYYCFGCHAKGDAIKFVRETENVGFMEAVEILAREAGMPMPERDPQAQKRADERSVLADVMEQAVRHYRLQLQTAQAADARAYLATRGLNGPALERWEIGFAPDVRHGVLDALTARGIEEAKVIEAGLAALPDRGARAYDRFRGRIIFPIRDARGRAIALGGRAMDPNARAKYLNSPQTALFDKGRSLFNHAPAREAAGKGERLIVAEGYMDVIALSEAGFRAAVAPLGTAITEYQLHLLWRISPEPVVALDGDASGVKAAMRLMDLALPMIEPGRSLRFAMMPPGQDPDDVIRNQGATAMRAIIEGAEPMVALLWRQQTEGKVFDSPERRAALDRALDEAVRKIPDTGLRAHYNDELKRLRWDLFNPRQTASTRPRRQAYRPMSREERARQAEAGRFGQAIAPAAATSALARDDVSEATREALILVALICHPSLIPQFEGELERLDLSGPEHNEIRALILESEPESLNLRAEVVEKIGADALDRMLGTPHVRVSPAVGDDTERAGQCLGEELAKLAATRGARREMDEALMNPEAVDENVVWRISRASGAKAGAKPGDTGSDDFEMAENGVRLSRRERDAFRKLYDAISYTKKPQRGD